ncbi:MAG: hypothetical protein ACRDKG_02640 [Actinomycetota bacterium]
MDEPLPEETHEPDPGLPKPAGSDGAAVRRRVSSLHPPEVLMIVSGALFVIATFLPWYEASVGPLTVSETAWNVGVLGVMAALCGLITTAVAIASPLGLGNISTQTAALVGVVLAPATLFFTMLRVLIDPPGAAVTQFTLGLVRVSRGIGLWGALVLAVAMTGGAVQKYRAVALR